MGLIAVAADKGAPGVSTAAVAVALSWPRPVLLAECDPAGSDLPWWLPTHTGQALSPARGLMSLAAAVRGGPAAGSPRAVDHAQVLDGGLPVLVGPAGPEQATAIGSAWAGIAHALAEATDSDGGGGGVDAVADCGRLVSASSPAVPVLQSADLVVLVTRATVGAVAHLRHGLTVTAQLLNAAGGAPAASRIVVLVVDEAGPRLGGGLRVLGRGAGRRGAGSGGARQVAEVLEQTPGLDDVPVVGVLAWDPKAAAALAGRGWGRPLARSALLRSATGVAAVLAERLAGPAAPAPEHASGTDNAAPAALAAVGGMDSRDGVGR